jgi:hypothetical protein
MSQLSAPIDYIVDHILPNYSDTELSGMLAARTNKDSLLYRAILREMGDRCANDRDGENY